MITLVGWLGIGGFILGIFNIYLSWNKHRKDKPIIKIEKKLYKEHKKFEELNPIDYAEKALSGDLNDVPNFRIKELVVNITNEGHRDAKLKEVSSLYKQKGRGDFSPKVISFNPTTIIAGDREEVHLFFEFPIHIIKEIEKTLPNEIQVVFDFAHGKISKTFFIGKHTLKLK